MKTLNTPKLRWSFENAEVRCTRCGGSGYTFQSGRMSACSSCERKGIMSIPFTELL